MLQNAADSSIETRSLKDRFVCAVAGMPEFEDGRLRPGDLNLAHSGTSPKFEFRNGLEMVQNEGIWSAQFPTFERGGDCEQPLSAVAAAAQHFSV
ncbi:hypothetical protein L596_015004 [Steinernema carpocapsae]|uniref:Uncharacterized protein n=1 Tax=Steinernema carpocapsae TaxID=34508 RepID=A0A4U5NEJ4_STECR|nr:hypothetical protein L596_015004 [Steinernema carpocapsae]